MDILENLWISRKMFVYLGHFIDIQKKFDISKYLLISQKMYCYLGKLIDISENRLISRKSY